MYISLSWQYISGSMGLDILPYFYLGLSVILGLVSALFPNSFLGCYFFFHTFLMMREQKVDFGLFSISSYRAFAGIFLLVFLSRHGKNLKSFFSDFSKLHYGLLVIFFLSTLLPVLFHYLWWEVFPAEYFLNSLKSSWILILFLYPKKQWNWQKINQSLIVATLAIFMITTIPSLQFFSDTGRGFYRLRHFNDFELAYTKFFRINGEKIPIFSLSETSSLLWTILSVPLIFQTLEMLKLEWTKALSAYLTLAYVTTIIFINQVYKMVLTEIVIIAGYLFYLVLASLKRPKSSWKMLVVISLFFIGLINVTNKYESFDYHAKFRVTPVDLAKTINDYTDRYQILMFSLMKTIHTSPLKGFGYPANFSDETKLPYGNSVREATGHMEGIDKIFYLGLPLGILASALYLIPLFFSLVRFKAWFKKDSLYSIQLLTMSLLILGSRFFGELGRDVYTNVIMVYFLVLMIIFDQKKDIDENSQG